MWQIPEILRQTSLSLMYKKEMLALKSLKLSVAWSLTCTTWDTNLIQPIHPSAKQKQSIPGTEMGQREGRKGLQLFQFWSLLDSKVLTSTKVLIFCGGKGQLSQMRCDWIKCNRDTE